MVVNLKVEYFCNVGFWINFEVVVDVIFIWGKGIGNVYLMGVIYL